MYGYSDSVFCTVVQLVVLERKCHSTKLMKYLALGLV